VADYPRIGTEPSDGWPRLQVTLPLPASTTLVNMLGLLALAGVSVAVGGLTGTWWWSLLVGCSGVLVLVVLASVAIQTETETEQPAKPTPIATSRAAS